MMGGQDTYGLPRLPRHFRCARRPDQHGRSPGQSVGTVFRFHDRAYLLEIVMGLPATSPKVRCGYVVRVQVYQSARCGIVSGAIKSKAARISTFAVPRQ